MKVKEESESWVGLATLTLINSLITEQEELNKYNMSHINCLANHPIPRDSAKMTSSSLANV